MGIYFVFFACAISCPSNLIQGDAVLTKVNYGVGSTVVGEAGLSHTCLPDLITTADQKVAEAALAQGAEVYRVSPRLKVYKLSRSAVYHVDEVEQAAPSAPK